MNYRKYLAVAAVLGIASVRPASAQNAIRWSGLFYMDYEYVFSSDDEVTEGENGFDYRRMYLTADYTLSDEFSGRARLEAAGDREDSSPFVKDLYLKWKGALAEGHDLVFGVQSPPVFTLSEKMWGYRSLEKTIMDRQKVASSRDMGIAANGRLTADGNLTYGVMLGNNNSIRSEDDKYKRVYGQLAWQSDKVAASLGGDYAAGVDHHAINANAFGGYSGKLFRVGAEGYFQRIDPDDDSSLSVDKTGVSVWLIKPVYDKVEVIGRADFSQIDDGVFSTNETFFIGGVAFSPSPDVHLIPNLILVDATGYDDPDVSGRVTLHADF